MAKASPENSDTKFGAVIAFRSDRLGARLNVIVNAKRVSDQYDLPFLFYWYKTMEGFAASEINDPKELFDADFVDAHVIDQDQWHFHSRVAQVANGDDFSSSSALIDWVRQEKNALFHRGFIGHVVLPDEDAETVAVSFREAFRSLPLTPKLAALCQQIDAKIGSATAYHIRRGDITVSVGTSQRAWPHKFVPDELYLEHMQHEMDRGQNMLLFSDDPDRLCQYRATVPSLKGVEDLVDLGGLTIAQRDFIDIYAMSRCQKIVAPHHSAFSGFAATLGGGELCDVGRELSRAQRDHAYTTLMERIETAPDSFPNDGEVAQSLEHLSAWSKNRPDFARVLGLQMGFVRQGKSYGFVFLSLMRNLIAAHDFAGVVEAASHAKTQPRIRDTKQWSEVHALEALAHFALGDQKKGTELLGAAIATDPAVRIIKELASAAVTKGFLSEANFVPTPQAFLDQPGRTQFTEHGPMSPLIAEAFDLQQPTFGAWHVVLAADWPEYFSSGKGAWLNKMLKDVDRLHETFADHKSLHAELFLANQSFRKLGKQKAVSNLNQLCDAHPENPYPVYLLSRKLEEIREYPEALAAAKQAHGLAPNTPMYGHWLGLMALEAKQPETAVSRLKDLCEQLPLSARFHKDYAEALLATGAYEEALARIRDARKLLPFDERYAVVEAKCLVAGDQVDLAAHLIEDRVSNYQAGKYTFAYLHDLYSRVGNVDAAQRAAETGEARFPGLHKSIKARASR